MEQRALEAERIARLIARDLVRDVSRDVGVVEVLVIEHGPREAERGHEAVDRREPVLTFSHVEVGAEGPCPLRDLDNENPLAVALNQVERLSRRADRAACRPQERLERIAGARSVEDVTGTHREIGRQAARPLAADPRELDVVDPPFVDGERERAGRLVELGGDLGEREALVTVVVLDLVGNLVGRCR